MAPPVALLDFSEIPTIPGLQSVFAGSRDQFAPADQLEALLPLWQSQAELHLIQGADHFFSHHIDKLQTTLGAAIKSLSAKGKN